MNKEIKLILIGNVNRGVCPCISTLVKGGTQQIEVLVNGSKGDSTNGQHN